VLDLEDAVPQAEKAAAREAIAGAWAALQAIGVSLVVRTNQVDQALGLHDLYWLAQLAQPFGVMLPKAKSEAALELAHARLPQVPLLPLIESAGG
jgi:citrate lyase subunit beta/citryl-CoA lyase